MIQPTHLANPHSYARNECRTPWDNDKFPDEPDPLTTDLDEVTCRACRQALVKKMVCPRCGEKKLEYGWTVKSTSGVVDGRLRLGEVRAVFYLACEYCSETVIPTIDPDEVAAALTEARWTP